MTADDTPIPSESPEPGSAPASAPPRATRRWSRRRRRRFVRTLLLAAGVLVVLVLAGVAWYEIEANPSGPEGRGVVVTVGNGESTNSVVQHLANTGVITSALAFRVGEVFGGTPVVQPGIYLFHRNQTFGQVRSVLAGRPDVFAIDVPPGFTLHEVAERVGLYPGHQAAAFAAVANSGAVRSPWSPPGSTNLEGLLGTGTYLLLPGESDTALLTAMVTRFDQSAARAGLTPQAAATLGMTPYQVIIAASIVEKEGVYEKNMGPVARVIYNRLASGMHLDMDSTVLYSLGQDGGHVTAQDEAIDTPYNTYLHAGLTPTPICVPSEEALAAAVAPSPGAWLYFVVVAKDGSEAFADTYAEQLANQQLAASRGVP
jgi:UPF0755 protein